MSLVLKLGHHSAVLLGVWNTLSKEYPGAGPVYALVEDKVSVGTEPCRTFMYFRAAES